MMDAIVILSFTFASDHLTGTSSSVLIELAYCILDTQTKTTTPTRSIVLQHPGWTLPLPPALVHATGITDIQQGISLHEAIQILHESIQMACLNKSFCFCAFQSRQLRARFYREAMDQGVQLPTYLNPVQVYDMRQEVIQWSRTRSSTIQIHDTLPIMAHKLGIVVEERRGAHAECTLLGALATRMLTDEPGDVFGRPADSAADQVQFEYEQSRVVHLDGLPATCTQQDLLGWFATHDLTVEHMWMVRGVDGMPSCTGFVVAHSHADATRMLSFNGKMLNGCAVEVSPSSQQVIHHASALLSNFPSGDWMCPSCHLINYASRTTCFHCTNTFAGDWICGNVQCNFYNYKSRTHCLRCKSTRPDTGQLVDFAPSDWICPSCTFSNFSSRSSCIRCGTLVQNDMSYLLQQQHMLSMMRSSNNKFRPGDWYCPMCMNHNYASRQLCAKCPCPRPPMEYGTNGGKVGDWMCVGCGYYNYAKRTVCGQCSAAK